LYFLPLPQGHGSLRPIFFSTRTGSMGWRFCGGGIAPEPGAADRDVPAGRDAVAVLEDAPWTGTSVRLVCKRCCGARGSGAC